MQVSNPSKRWILAAKIDAKTDEVLSPYPSFLRQILFNRGIRTIEQADAYLRASTPLADPFLLLDMDKAVERLWTAIENDEGIAVYGDYDVDGVSATALMVEVIRRLGGNVTRYIPNRFDEGYGLNLGAIQFLADSNAKVILTVDCGIRSPREAELARELGVDLIISDHHYPQGDLPKGYAVLCPKREGDPYPDKDLAGVGVAFKIAQGLIKRSGRLDVNAEEWLDLVALGTVADIVPLTGENRVMVRKGLSLIRLGRRPGLTALAGVAGKDYRTTTATDIGFILGPRLNAAGRMESALQAYELLIGDSLQEVGKAAQILENQNKDRQIQTRKAQEKAQGDLGDIGDQKLVAAFSEEYSSGIIGLVASRLVETYYRPALVGSIDGDEIRASCRSIPEFHITKALDECADLLVRHGGHSMAAGLTVRSENMDALVMRLQEIAERKLAGLDLRPALRADVELDISEIAPQLYTQLEDLQPTGMGNPSVTFITRGVHLDKMSRMGEDGKHISFAVRGCKIGRAVAFNQGAWFDTWMRGDPEFDIAYSIDLNRYFDRVTQQLNIKDIRLSGRPD